VIDPPEVARRVRQGFVPIISAIDGFVAYYLVSATFLDNVDQRQ